MGTFRIIPYEPNLFDTVLNPSKELPPHSALHHRSFVNRYYASSEYARLFLVVDVHGALLATHGVEYLRCSDPGGSYSVGIASAFYSFRQGAGTYLLVNWLRSCQVGLAFGFTDDVRRVLQQLRWNFVPGVHTYCVNVHYANAQDRPLRALIKRLVNLLLPARPLVRLPSRLPRSCDGVTVREVTQYSQELLDFDSGFPFRFSPDLPHLAWRYQLEQPFVRYRLFEVFSETRRAGYVILQDRAGELLVSHSDGIDPVVLAAGTVQALAAASRNPGDRRQVTLTSAHPAMQAVFERVGFKHLVNRTKVLALGTMKGPFHVPVPLSEWLVNADWGDRGLRRPFLDEPPFSNPSTTH